MKVHKHKVNTLVLLFAFKTRHDLLAYDVQI